MIISQPRGHVFLLASTWPLPYLTAWMCHGNEPDLPGKEGFFDVEGPCYMAWEGGEGAVKETEGQKVQGMSQAGDCCTVIVPVVQLL